MAKPQHNDGQKTAEIRHLQSARQVWSVGCSRGSALLARFFFGSFLENPLRAVEWDLTFHEVPLDVREPVRSGPFVRYNDMLAIEFVDAM
jgi:hypothetical protein